MLKGRVSTIDEEFEKGQDTPKLTKEESAEWLNMKIMNKAKDCIRYPGKDQEITIDAVTNRVYEGLVEDWGYNNIILLNAMRTLKVDRAYIMAVIEILFDEDGEPISASEPGGSEAKQPIAQPTAEPAYSEDGRASPYYTASLISIDEAHEAHDELEKSQVKGFVRTKKGKLERVNPFSRKGEAAVKVNRKLFNESKSNVLGYMDDILDHYNEHSVQSLRHNYDDNEVNKVVGESVAYAVDILRESESKDDIRIIPHLLEWASQKYRVEPKLLNKLLIKYQDEHIPNPGMKKGE